MGAGPKLESRGHRKWCISIYANWWKCSFVGRGWLSPGFLSCPGVQGRCHSGTHCCYMGGTLPMRPAWRSTRLLTTTYFSTLQEGFLGQWGNEIHKNQFMKFEMCTFWWRSTEEEKNPASIYTFSVATQSKFISPSFKLQGGRIWHFSYKQGKVYRS